MMLEQKEYLFVLDNAIDCQNFSKNMINSNFEKLIKMFRKITSIQV